jgi:hypothetical protein
VRKAHDGVETTELLAHLRGVPLGLAVVCVRDHDRDDELAGAVREVAVVGGDLRDERGLDRDGDGDLLGGERRRHRQHRAHEGHGVERRGAVALQGRRPKA